jgi:hypothetical protein
MKLRALRKKTSHRLGETPSMAVRQFSRRLRFATLLFLEEHLEAQRVFDLLNQSITPRKEEA